MEISSISSLSSSGLQSITKNVKTATASDSVEKTFEDVLTSLSKSENNADTLLTQLASGEDVDVADVMIATTENDVNFRVAMAIRDKLVDAYREVMRMSV